MASPAAAPWRLLLRPWPWHLWKVRLVLGRLLDRRPLHRVGSSPSSSHLPPFPSVWLVGKREVSFSWLRTREPMSRAENRSTCTGH